MDSALSRISISNFLGDFSDPVDPDDFDAPRDAHPPNIPQLGDLHLPFDDAIKKLEGLVGFNLKPGQRKALEELYMGSDLCLIAATGFGKTIVFTGYYTLFKPEAGALTIIVSPQGNRKWPGGRPMETGFELPSFRGHGRHQYSRKQSRYRPWEIHTYMDFC